ncbi:helix-turn-helix transcriptional regulator [Micrococcus luteus]|nr:helix-turn-helix transcriptional regulator [Micrococcus luteus]MCV7574079.1 helix-turn-helix transcriptional regulator [Micrococcus luteus]MCV7708685.1 helix-turn-helix transcriptional regulator [Micrococcus luteus]
MTSKRPVTTRNLTAREIDERIGQRITGIIEMRNQTAAPAFDRLTHADLAEKLGMSRTYFTRILAGQKPLQRKYLVPLAELLAVDPGLIAHPDELPLDQRSHTEAVAA